MCEAEVIDFPRVKRDKCHTRTAGSDLRRRHLSLDVVRRVHHDGLYGLISVVQDVNLCHWAVALVDFVELHAVDINEQVAESQWIVAREVDDLIDDNAFQCEHQRLVAIGGVDADLLLEMSHRLGIVGGTNGEIGGAVDESFRIVDGGASAAGAHVRDADVVIALVMQFILCHYRLTKHHLTYIQHLVLGLNALGRRGDAAQAKQTGREHFPIEIILHFLLLMFS